MGTVLKKIGGASALGLALGAVLTMGSSASAAVKLDFLGMADNVPPGEQAVEAATTINPFSDPVYVTIPTSAFGFTGFAGDALADLTEAPYAYLDSNSAGMGVCSTGLKAGSRDCFDAGDDNVQLGEVLGFLWGSDLQIDSVSLRGEGHPNDPSFDDGEFFAYSLDSGANWATTQMINAKDGDVAINGTVTAGNYLLFATSVLGPNAGPNAHDNEQFYISAITVVPVPAVALLLATALGGLGLMGRRRQKAA